ncbi:MAG: hypothetical protein JST43_02690 [Bacteroidetes bacterium]|nr:hypothetical protein [Bacteroidota bacterium]MBS1540364.1 hypothetical protein [Bacteroidota bacterium]
MDKFLLAILLVKLLSVPGAAQVKKQFTVEKTDQYNSVDLSLKAKTGNCFIRPSEHDDILNVYSNLDIEEYSHSFSNEIKGKTCVIKLSLERESQRGVGRKISHHVFGTYERASEKFWKVYLTEELPYSLNLDYGLGNSNIDLAGLAISKLKINTGSADVNVSYSTKTENKIEMDTFSIKVDMGSVAARQLNLARSKYVLADVGFGNMLLDFSDKPVMAHHIKGTVGAGNLVIHLPSQETPVIVRISDSWLCSVNLSRNLKKIGDNTFANAAYSKNAKNILTFDLDVSMGKIIFKENN